MGHSFVDEIEDATLGESAEIREMVAQLRAETIKAEEQAADRAAYISQQSKILSPSISIDLKKNRVTFVSFDPEADPVKTISFLRAQMAPLRKHPHSNRVAKEQK